MTNKSPLDEVEAALKFYASRRYYGSEGEIAREALAHIQKLRECVPNLEDEKYDLYAAPNIDHWVIDMAKALNDFIGGEND